MWQGLFYNERLEGQNRMVSQRKQKTFNCWSAGHITLKLAAHCPFLFVYRCWFIVSVINCSRIRLNFWSFLNFTTLSQEVKMLWNIENKHYLNFEHWKYKCVMHFCREYSNGSRSNLVASLKQRTSPPLPAIICWPKIEYILRNLILFIFVYNSFYPRCYNLIAKSNAHLSTFVV